MALYAGGTEAVPLLKHGPADVERYEKDVARASGARSQACEAEFEVVMSVEYVQVDHRDSRLQAWRNAGRRVLRHHTLSCVAGMPGICFEK